MLVRVPAADIPGVGGEQDLCLEMGYAPGVGTHITIRRSSTTLGANYFSKVVLITPMIPCPRITILLLVKLHLHVGLHHLHVGLHQRVQVDLPKTMCIRLLQLYKASMGPHSGMKNFFRPFKASWLVTLLFLKQSRIMLLRKD